MISPDTRLFLFEIIQNFINKIVNTSPEQTICQRNAGGYFLLTHTESATQ